VWADGIHLQARLEDEKQCILVIIGATPEGAKELVVQIPRSSRPLFRNEAGRDSDMMPATIPR
jgi:hypothetical protein